MTDVSDIIPILMELKEDVGALRADVHTLKETIVKHVDNDTQVHAGFDKRLSSTERKISHDRGVFAGIAGIAGIAGGYLATFLRH